MSTQLQEEHATAVERVAVTCQCVDATCTERIAMTIAQHDAVRRALTRFVVKAGHEVAGNERIVSEAADYVVVETHGRPAATAPSASELRA